MTEQAAGPAAFCMPASAIAPLRPFRSIPERLAASARFARQYQRERAAPPVAFRQNQVPAERAGDQPAEREAEPGPRDAALPGA